MISLEQRVTPAIEYIREQVHTSPSIGLILGSGLGAYAETLKNAISIGTAAIPNYPASSVEGHKGRLVFASLEGKEIVAFQGRVHFYESNDVESVLLPIYVAHQLGVRRLIITNAAGGINRALAPGDLMVISDQIDLTTIPLPFSEGLLRARRPLYDSKLLGQVREIGERNAIRLKAGVYVGLKGPSYETAAEIEMIHRIGGDAVGMSTVLEVSIATSLGIRVVGISCITNLATGITNQKLSHAEVTEVGNKVKDRLAHLIGSIIRII
jgi:purine-nucleoside phosphorylase